MVPVPNDDRTGIDAAVTAIIPTHNRRDLLARTLRSVLAQEDVELRVVVVDDGGSDGTEQYLRELDDDRVSYLRHPTPRGVSAARNTGIAAATTPWLAFVDDDDLWAPGKLRAQLDALAATPGAGWSCTGAVNIDHHLRPFLWIEPPTESNVGDLLLSHNAVPGGGSGVLASRELTLAVGGFDEAMSNLADWDYYIRLALRSPLAPVHRPLLGYYIHPAGMAHNLQRSAHEYQYLGVKYGRERKERGVEQEQRNWLVYLAGQAYRGGQRWAGMRLHVELVGRHRRWRSLRAVVMGLAPDRVRAARTIRPSTHVPPGWPEEVEQWLPAYH